MNSRKSFGGAWSDKKLQALEEYLTAYTTALSKTPFKLGYIDAFAGAGKHETDDNCEDQSYRHGSPFVALETTPNFNQYIFIDKDQSSLERLQTQIEDNPDFEQKSIIYHCEDANTQLQDLCSKNWEKHRAVAFLDPFSLSIKWETLKAVAATQAIDLWLLFPAMAVNRMLAKSGKLDESWRKKLNETFGSDEWESAFYRKEEPDLLGYEKKYKVPDIFDKLTDFVTMRLDSIFEKTVQKPLILKNSTGSPLFLLCFASGNKRGAPIAINIAEHIINKQS